MPGICAVLSPAVHAEWREVACELAYARSDQQQSKVVMIICGAVVGTDACE